MPRRPSPFQVDRVRVRVHSGPREDGRWRWRADRPDGRGGRVHVWAGWATRDEAGEIVRELLAEAVPDPESTELETVRDLLECWVAAVRERRDVSELTQRNCRAAAERLVSSGLADARLAILGRLDLERHRDTALRAGVGGATLARDLKYLRQAWRWATEGGYLRPRALPSVRVERVRTVYTRYTPSLDDVAALLEGLSPAVRRGVILLAATGCRASEVTGLTWAHVPLDARHIRVSGKTGEREVALHPAVAGEVRRWPRGRPDGKVVGVTGNTIRTALAERSAELGLPRVSPNGLRRHVVDALYRTGQIDAAASQLGHSAATALSIYRQVTAADRARAVEGAELGVVQVLDVVRKAKESG